MGEKQCIEKENSRRERVAFGPLDQFASLWFELFVLHLSKTKSNIPDLEKVSDFLGAWLSIEIFPGTFVIFYMYNVQRPLKENFVYNEALKENIV